MTPRGSPTLCSLALLFPPGSTARPHPRWWPMTASCKWWKCPTPSSSTGERRSSSGSASALLNYERAFVSCTVSLLYNTIHMRKAPLLSLVAATAAAASVLASSAAKAEVIYSGLQNITIPTSFEGVYLNLATGATSTGQPSDYPDGRAAWDINPFFGGSGVATSPNFLPARTGTGKDDPILALGSGMLVNNSLLFPSGYDGGYGGSETHMGSGAGKFQPGQEAYIGFKFTTESSAIPLNAWMRVVFTINAPGGVIKDWAYETANEGSITTGNILRSASSGGASVVTLSGATGENATLGSTLADPGNGTVTALDKTGAGTWTMNTDQAYTGDTTISSGGGTLEVGGANGKLSGTSSIVVNDGGSLLLSGSGGTNSKLNTSADVTLSGGEINMEGLTSSLDQSVGALTLTASSILDFGSLTGGHTWRFGASNADWSTVGLNIWNYTPGSDRLFFGSNSMGLTGAQLGRITFFSGNGIGELGTDGEHPAIQPVPPAGPQARGRPGWPARRRCSTPRPARGSAGRARRRRSCGTANGCG
ncbi:MAG: hypothetical protein EOO70_01200 [Myxococcaceae bacterium]|nr:MAG: hypothetical protein EOO70_01200 [Myxococcaceae bacterium]